MSSSAPTRFTISQQFTPFVNRFDIYDSEGQAVGFAEQKRFNLREKITVWKNGARDEVFFSISAEKVFDMRGKYFVQDGAGNQIGYVRKMFTESLLRSTWGVYDPSDNLLYTAREKNVTIAVIRRAGMFVPVVGEILEQLPFGFELLKDGRVVGHHRRIRGLRDKYDVFLDDHPQESDRRLLLALGLLLDILQQR